MVCFRREWFITGSIVFLMLGGLLSGNSYGRPGVSPDNARVIKHWTSEKRRTLFLEIFI